MSSQRNGTDTLSAMSFQVTCAYLLFYHSVFLYYIISLSPPLPFLPSYTPSCFLHSSSFPSFLDSFSTSLFHSFLPSSISSFFFTFLPYLLTHFILKAIKRVSTGYGQQQCSGTCSQLTSCSSSTRSTTTSP
jgi:ABC-type sulfate transport system permease component